MNRAEMVTVIFTALEQGAAANRLEPERKGATLTKIRNNHALVDTVGEEKLNRIYERAKQYLNTQTNTNEALPNNTQTDTQKKENTPTATLTVTNNTQKEGTLTERIEALERENMELKERIARLEGIKKEQKPVRQYTKNTQKVMGWSLSAQKNTVHGYVYKRWVATRRIDGKQRNIYLGNSPDKAEEKIRAYCQTKGLLGLLDLENR